MADVEISPRRGLVSHTIFALAMFAIAALTLHLFYQGVRAGQAPQGANEGVRAGQAPQGTKNSTDPTDSLWAKEVMLLMVVIVFVPFTLFFVELRQHWKDKDPSEPLLDLSIHAVPYGILALSMLFEYKKVQERESEGLVALASIMIIFILAELGLFMYTNTKKAKRVSEVLGGRLDTLGATLEGLPWVSHYLQLTDAATSQSPAVDEVGKLLAEWASLFREKKSHPSAKALLNIFLRQYIQEEILDVSGKLPADFIPAIVAPPVVDKIGKVSYFATNVGFYAAFVENAANHLASDAIKGRIDPEDAPCLAIITNSLPSQFWNWPRDDKHGECYPPITSYLKAQVDGAKSHSLRIFRTILVGESKNEVDVAVGLRRHAEMPLLWDQTEWRRQLDWFFIFNKSATRGDPLTSDMIAAPTPENLAPILGWTPPGRTQGPKKVYWMVTKEDPADKQYDYVNVWRYYCDCLHRTARNEEIGRTEVFAIGEELFSTAIKDGGFGGCPDLMFLGTCPKKEENVWDSDEVDWSMALMTTMSTQTETMFLTLIHDTHAVNVLWDNIQSARRSLAGPALIADSKVALQES